MEHNLCFKAVVTFFIFISRECSQLTPMYAQHGLRVDRAKLYPSLSMFMLSETMGDPLSLSKTAFADSPPHPSLQVTKRFSHQLQIVIVRIIARDLRVARHQVEEGIDLERDALLALDRTFGVRQVGELPSQEVLQPSLVGRVVEERIVLLLDGRVTQRRGCFASCGDGPDQRPSVWTLCVGGRPIAC